MSSQPINCLYIALIGWSFLLFNWDLSQITRIQPHFGARQLLVPSPPLPPPPPRDNPDTTVILSDTPLLGGSSFQTPLYWVGGPFRHPFIEWGDLSDVPLLGGGSFQTPLYWVRGPFRHFYLWFFWKTPFTKDEGSFQTLLLVVLSGNAFHDGGGSFQNFLLVVLSENAFREGGGPLSDTFICAFQCSFQAALFGRGPSYRHILDWSWIMKSSFSIHCRMQLWGLSKIPVVPIQTTPAAVNPPVWSC